MNCGCSPNAVKVAQSADVSQRFVARNFNILTNRGKVLKTVECRKFFTLTGQTTNKSRDKIEDELRSGDILLATASGGESRNFQAVNNVIFYDIPFSVQDFIQGLGRTDRMGSTYKTINAYVLVTEDTIDEYKSYLLEKHLGLIKDVIGSPVELPNDFESKSIKAIEYTRKRLLWRKRGKKGRKGNK